MTTDDLTLAEVVRRLVALESARKEDREHIDRRLDNLTAQMAQLGFVRVDVYASDQRAADLSYKAITERIESTDRRAMWAIALVCTVTIGAIITAILTTAGVFK